MYSTLAYVRVGREERTHKINYEFSYTYACSYLYTNNNTLEDTRMPSLENWDGGLKIKCTIDAVSYFI